MANNRSTRLRQRVQDLLGDTNGLGIAKAKAVYAALDRVQTRICEESNAFETSGSMTLTAGTELYPYPDGMISETAIALGSFAPVVFPGGGSLSGSVITGLMGGVPECIVSTTPQVYTFDTPFTKTYINSLSQTTPAYRFLIESAQVDGSTDNETINVIAKTLSSVTLSSSSDNTRVRFRAEE